MIKHFVPQRANVRGNEVVNLQTPKWRLKNFIKEWREEENGKWGGPKK